MQPQYYARSDISWPAREDRWTKYYTLNIATSNLYKYRSTLDKEVADVFFRTLQYEICMPRSGHTMAVTHLGHTFISDLSDNRTLLQFMCCCRRMTSFCTLENS